MIKILFVCHGNICRSPMAEFIFKDIIEKEKLTDKFFIRSAATSAEEIGNPVYPPARRKLMEHNISCEGKRAVQIKKSDYDYYDYIIAMEQFNIRNILKIVKDDKNKKIFRLLEFTDNPKDIADPWYTGDFHVTYDEILEGCRGLLKHILKHNLNM